MDKKSEYEMQHFGFSAKQISLERKFTLQKLVINALSVLVQKIDCSPTTTELLLAQKDEIKSRILEAFQDEVQTLEELDEKHFSIPSHVLLTPDLDQLAKYTLQDEQTLDENLASVKQQFLENSIMMTLLKIENDQYGSIVGQHRQEMCAYYEAVMRAVNNIASKKLCDLFDNTLRITE